MQWISVNDRLPEENKYVLARHNRGTWCDKNDQENVNCVVVKLVKGISKSERDAMPDNAQRKREYHPADEAFNNVKPYCWDVFGPDRFFGQSISHWMPLPPPPESD